jgi:filamentous hemagglutinin family protein
MFKFTPEYSSRFRILKGGKISLVVSAFLTTVSLYAAPTGGSVTSGSATISQSGSTTNITQSTQKASINWNNFSIAGNETVNFNQPNTSSITLNRVIGGEKSIIDGALNANGQVWILNSNGVLFNSTSKVNTAGILATTKNISDVDFQNGNYKFTGESTQSVVNMGEITISDKGYATLLATNVSNEGTIKAVQGTIALVGADAYTINLNGNSLVDIQIDKGVIDSLVENKGAIIADGGKIIMTSKAADEILKNVVNNSGIIEAKSFDDMFGSVEIVAQGGYIEHSGTIDVSSTTGKGGTATVTGYHTMITDTGVINADGKTGGGTIQVGGSYQNSDTSVYQAVGTIVEHGAKLTANAIDNGDGGTVVAWSDIYNPDSVTRAYGTFEAKGGVNGGDGGKIETSGNWLDVKGIDSVLANAYNGENGSWLLDPADIIIGGGTASGGFYPSGTDNRWQTDGFSSSSSIDVHDLQTALGNGRVIVDAMGYGTGGSGHITINTNVTWSANELFLIASGVTLNANLNGSSLRIHAAGGTISSSLWDTITMSGAIDFIQCNGTLNGQVIANGGWMTLTNSNLKINAGSYAGYGVNLTANSKLYLNGNYTQLDVGMMSNDSYVYLQGNSFLRRLTATQGSVYNGDGYTFTVNNGDYAGRFEGSNQNLIIGNGAYSGTIFSLGNNTGITGNVSISGGATLQLSGSALGNATLTNNGQLTIAGGSSIKNYSGWGSTNLNAGLNISQDSAYTYSGSFNGSGNLGLLGSTTFTLSGSGSHSGAVSIGSGMTVVMNNGNALGTSGAVTVGSGATLNLGGITTSSGKSFTLSGGTITGSGTIGGAVTLAANTTLSPSNYLYFNGSISGAYGLTINNSYATVFNGSVNIASLTKNYTSTTTINNNITTSGTQTYGGAVSVTGARTLTGSSLNFNGNLTGNNALTLVGNSSGLTVNGAVNIGSNALTLRGTSSGSGTFTINNTMTAGSLLLQNIGTATLTDTSKFSGVTTIAASGVGTLNYLSNGALSIGTVGGVDGITATGTVEVATNSGDLTLLRNVTTSNTTATAMILNAGKNTAAGTSTGGNIVINGGTISVGSGGIAKLYSGSLSNNTLATLIGLGSGRFRYNSDETTTNYTKALSTGLNLIYREQPTIGATISSASKTYDGLVYDGTPSLTYTLQNGDTAGSDITFGTSEISGEVNNPNAGTYTISAALTGFTNTLGYANPTTATEGTLTINKRALSLSGTKVYDSTTDIDASKLTTFTNLVGTQTVTLSGIGTVANKNVANGKTVTIGTLVLGDGENGGLSNNYILTGGTHTIDITKADISSIGGITASNKVYDGTTTAALTTSGAVFNGKFGSDVLTVATSTGNFTDKNVADGKTVNITALTLGGTDAGNYNIVDTTASTTANITPRAITLSSATADNREYNGIADTTATIETWGAFTNIIPADSSKVNVDETNVVANFDNGNKGTGKNVAISGIALSGDEASNYSIVGTFTTTGDITPKTLGIAFGSAPTKVYDGTTTITAGGDLSLTGIIGSEDVSLDMSGATYTYADKNAGTNKSLIFSNVNLTGTEGGNYQLDLANVPTNASITRLDTVTWTGGASGNWFDAANWGGKVPDLSNVANVVIPEGVTISFDTSGATAGVSTNAVNIDTLGSLGSLNMSDGTLNVSNTLALDSFTQSGGTIGGATNVTLNTLVQSGGTITNIGDLQVNDSFTQSNTAGTITVGGDVAITQTTGDLILGNIANGGAINAVASSGNITQLSGSTLAPTNLASFTSSGNITLTNSGNDFSSIALSGVDVSFIDSVGGVSLDAITTTGTLSAVSTDGDILQVADAILSVDGVATLDGGTNSVDLANATNDFKNTVNVSAAQNVVLSDANGIELGDITTTGTLGINAVDNITQKAGTTLAITGTTTLASTSGDVTLTNATNNFSTINVTAKDVVLADINGIELGDITTTGTLGVNTQDDITQKAGTGLITSGDIVLASVGGDITLDSVTNNFGGNLDINADDISISNYAHTLTLGNIVSQTSLDISTSNQDIVQAVGTTLTSNGVAILNSGTADITLTNDGNDFTTLALTGNNVSFKDSVGGTTLGDIVTTGTLSATNTVGGITQEVGASMSIGTDASFDVGTNDFTLSNTGNNFGSLGVVANDVTISNISGDLTLGNMQVAGTLGVNIENDILQKTGTTIDVTGVTTLATTSGDIALDGNNNDFSTINVSGNNVALADINGIELGDITTTGTLGVSATENITQKVGTALVTGGDVALATTSGDITLDSDTNNFGGSFGASGENITLTNYAHALTLGNIVSQTALSITTDNQAITQAVGTILTSTGTASLDAGTSDITLTNDGNDFNELTLVGDNLSFKDSVGGVTLGSIATAGTFSGTSTGGDITQKTGTTLALTGDASFDSGTYNTVLTNDGNDFTTLALTGNNVSFKDSVGTTTLGDVTTTGTLSATNTVGGITQGVGASMSIGTDASFDVGTNDFTLSNSGNNFGSLGVVANDVTISNISGDLTLGNMDVAGTLGINIENDILQKTGTTIDVTGVTTLATTSGDIALDGANNDFSTINVSGNNVALADINGIELGDITTTGTLGVEAIGDISQTSTSVIATTGITTLSSTTGDIALDGANNDFSTINVSGNNVALADINGIELGDITTTGTLGVEAIGDISQTSTSIITAIGETSLASTTGDIALDGEIIMTSQLSMQVEIM